jgi:hypothetical protein
MNSLLLDELIHRCDSEALTEEAIAPFLVGMSREEFCDIFSERVAHEYAADRIPFDVADAAMNRLFAFAYLGDEDFLPPFSREVFEAFDDGEYRHSDDPPDTDPVQKYTRPQILEIVSRGRR